MCNVSYEEYMRNVLGYMPGNCNCMQDTYENDYVLPSTNSFCPSASCQDENLEKMYPDIYQKVYPLVCKECRLNTMPLTQENIERMTDNVCQIIELDLKVNTTVKVEMKREDKTTNVRQQDTRETRQSNNALRDLIKILILRELIGGGFPGGRPPFPPRPPMPPRPRPPFPGPGGRPPFPGGPIPR